MNLKTILAAALAVVALTGCEDLLEEDNMQPDGSKPSLTINNPTGNQSVNQEQGLRVFVTAVDKDAVKKLDFKINGNETTFISFSRTPDRNVIELDTLVSTDNLKPGTYQLHVRATDGRTNISDQMVNFNVK